VKKLIFVIAGLTRNLELLVKRFRVKPAMTKVAFLHSLSSSLHDFHQWYHLQARFSDHVVG